MGVVYRGHDTRLDRAVAIKALPDHLAADPDRLARFEREARTLASLNHPNVAGIYGIEESEGHRYLILEYVEGPTLAERLDRGPLPLDEALEIATQIAAGVEAAHDAGIVHRDLKPGNVKITPGGKVKVLDFGLAKADESGSMSSPGVVSESPTLTTPLLHSPTIPGAILGTAPYMSPEQARGRNVDKRSDIWSFGVILYECLTGTSPFMGETVSDSIGAILHRDVDVSLLPPATPPAIHRLLRRCLAKDRNKRLHDIADARLEIDEAMSGATNEALDGARSRASRAPVVLLLVAIPIIAALAALGAWSLKAQPESAPAPLRKLEILVDGLQRDESHPPVISPDGTRIVYTSGGSLWVRPLRDLHAIELAGTQGASHAFWSPDSSQIGFHDGSRIWRMPAAGGARSMICVTSRALEVAGGVAWTLDNRIVFTAAWGDPFWAAPPSGGEPEAIVTPDPKVVQDFHFASPLPDGSGVLTILHRPEGSPDTIALIRDGEYETLLVHPTEELRRPVYANGYILYGRVQTTGTIWAAPFSLKTHKVTGPSVLVAESADLPSASYDGTLVYAASSHVGTGQLTWVDRTGAVLEHVGQPQPGLVWPCVSPSDAWAAVQGTETGASQIWVYDLARGTKRRLTAENSPEVTGWFDSDMLAYSSGSPSKTYAVSAAGNDPPRLLVDDETFAVSSDGRYALVDRRVDRSLDVLIFDAQNPGPGRPLLASSATETSPRVRPSGGWLAYVSDESGRDEVYLTRFPSAEGRWQVSVSGGVDPAWSASGDELFFTTNRTDISDLMSVRVTTEPGLRLSEPTRLFSGADSEIDLYRGWCPSSDGQRILGIRDITTKFEADRIVVVENWNREFEKAGGR